MWRTVIVSGGQKMTVKDNWLHIFTETDEKRVPIGDLYSVVIDNPNTLISQKVLTALSESGVHIIICNDRHLPSSVVLPLNCHSNAYFVFSRQTEISDGTKNMLWQKIVKQKIINQADALRLAGVNAEKYNEIQELAQFVSPGDTKNIEAVAARKYFRAFFGKTFRRSDDDVTNAALNYGYSIVRSAVAKSLTGYGYNCLLGLHHKSPTNSFNLADDIMEPLRPLVDLVVDSMCDELFEKLTFENKSKIISLVNLPVKFDDKNMRVRYAIDRCVASLTSFFNTGDTEAFKLPSIIKLNPLFEDDLDNSDD